MIIQFSTVCYTGSCFHVSCFPCSMCLDFMQELPGRPSFSCRAQDNPRVKLNACADYGIFGRSTA